VHAHRSTKSNQFNHAVTYYEGAIQLLEGLPEKDFSTLRVHCTLKLARCLLKSNVYKKVIARCNEAIDECSNILMTTPKEELKINQLKPVLNNFATALSLRSIAKMKLGGDQNEKSAAVDLANSLTCSNMDSITLQTSITDLTNIGYNPLDNTDEEDDTFFAETQRKRFSETELETMASRNGIIAATTTQTKKAGLQISLRSAVQMVSKLIGSDHPVMHKLLKLVDGWEYVYQMNTTYTKLFANYFDIIALFATCFWIGVLFV